VNYRSIEELIDTDVNGFLVGRDSLNVDKFGKLLQVANGI
jgi:hypothetical protein